MTTRRPPGGWAPWGSATGGRRGGFVLTAPPEETRLADLVTPFEALGEARRCLLGRGACSDVGGCPAHREWKEASAPLFRFLEGRTLADLVKGTPDDDPAVP
ncbi:MAG: Rrf2 family transcriptional regulator [Longimicrobiales bacterium]|nr:Rrf2 family transcriptional regulator [Longimicrobiales bacterium]